MTVKALEKKVAELEQEVRLLRHGIKHVLPRVSTKKMASVWKETYGVISKKRGDELLKALKKTRAGWDRYPRV